MLFSRFQSFQSILEVLYARKLTQLTLTTVWVRFKGVQGAFCNWKASATLASWRRKENQGYAASRSARESREDRGTAAASATGSRGPRGSLPGPRLDAPCLPRHSHSPRWGRPKLSTTSTTRRHHIWWSCLCRPTKSLWQTSKMSSRNQITNSSSNLWTMTSGNWANAYCFKRGFCLSFVCFLNVCAAKSTLT